MKQPFDAKDEKLIQSIHELINNWGVVPSRYAEDLTTEMIQTSLKLLFVDHDLGQLKLINRALKEMRHAFSIFNKFPNIKCISIFGSARTPPLHPDYKTAIKFSNSMAKAGWMCITGAAEGIMRAGMEGAQKESSFGLSIKLPFETTTNSLIFGDLKHMMFRYFFTRKIMFISHSHAVTAFPGGVGTMDELYEVLTLIQTGKSNIIPVVLLEGPGGSYWQHWNDYMEKQLFGNGWVSPSDRKLYHIATSVGDAKKHIIKFYSRYHSSRYVNDLLVIRIKNPLNPIQIKILNKKFSCLIASGDIIQGGVLPEENDFKELPRIIFKHTRKDMGILREMIDCINNF